MHRAPSRLLTAAAVVGLTLSACGGGGDALSTENVRARAQLADAGPSAVYLEITNDSDEDARLVGVSVPADVAGATEIHTTVPADGEMSDGEMSDGEVSDGEMSDGEMSDGEMSDGEMADGEMSGMGGMRMVQVDGIDVPAGETVTLEPGGLHIMLLDLPDDLADGDTFEATLEFEDGTTTTVDVEVTASP